MQPRCHTAMGKVLFVTMRPRSHEVKTLKKTLPIRKWKLYYYALRFYCKFVLLCKTFFYKIGPCVLAAVLFSTLLPGFLFFIKWHIFPFFLMSGIKRYLIPLWIFSFVGWNPFTRITGAQKRINKDKKPLENDSKRD